MRGRAVRRMAAVGAVGVVGLLASLHGSPVSAQTITVDIADGTLIQGPVGSVHSLGSQDVPADLVGQSCDLVIEVKNNESVHPGNSIIVSSGDSKVTLDKVEEEAGTSVSTKGTLVLGKAIDVSVKLGEDEMSSLGSEVSVTCTPVVTTTTLPEPPVPTPVTTTPAFAG